MKPHKNAKSTLVRNFTKFRHVRLMICFSSILLASLFSMFYSSETMAWDAGDPNHRCMKDPCNGGAIENSSVLGLGIGISPVVKVKIRGNTHLWIVNQAVQMLSRSDEPGAQRAAKVMLEPKCRALWQLGLYDGDDRLSDLFSKKTSGTHFYNPIERDFFGNHTRAKTYLVAELDVAIGSNNSARRSAKSSITKLYAAGPTAPSIDISSGSWRSISIENVVNSGCYQLGLALHYMTDMTQPMHTSSFSGLSSPMWLHPYFEAYVPVVQQKFPADVPWDKLWIQLNADQTLNETAIKSNGKAKDLQPKLIRAGKRCSMFDADLTHVDPYDGYCFVNKPDVDQQIGILLRDAYQSTASYIHNVFKDLNSNAGTTPKANHYPPPNNGGSPYVLCGYENQYCSFQDIGTVAYGVNGIFKYKQNVSRGIQCDDATFGFVVKGVEKRCYAKFERELKSNNTPNVSTNPGPPDGNSVLWKVCANDGQRCRFNGTGRVAYGFNKQGGFKFKDNVSGGIECRGAEFGTQSDRKNACYVRLN